MSNKLKFALLSTLALSSATFGAEAAEQSQATTSTATVAVAPGQNSPYDGVMAKMVGIMGKHVEVPSADTLAQQTTKTFAAFVKAHIALKGNVTAKTEELAELNRQLTALREQLTDLGTASADRVRALEAQVVTLTAERDSARTGALDAAAAAADLEGLDGDEVEVAADADRVGVVDADADADAADREEHHDDEEEHHAAAAAADREEHHADADAASQAGSVSEEEESGK